MKLIHEQISSELVPNPPPSILYVPPSRTDWDFLFQLLFEELLNPPSSVNHPAPEVIAPIAKVVAPEPAASTGSPSSTTVDQDAPSPNVAHMNNDPFFGIIILENNSEASSSSDFIPTVVQTAAPNSKHIEAMEEELHEFERLEDWELVPHPDKVMVITLKWIYKVKLDELGVARLDTYRFHKVPEAFFINQSRYALESLKKYCMESSDPVDTPMVEKSKLDEDTQRESHLVYQLENKNSKKNNDMDDFMFTTVRVISKHQDTQVYSAILPQHLTKQAMLESEAYMTYRAYVTGEKTPKPKSTKKKVDSKSSPKTKPTQASKGTLRLFALIKIYPFKNDNSS
ncbi:uncharacterized mitochondrial protein-like protein [Tanacetum coccineum]